MTLRFLVDLEATEVQSQGRTGYLLEFFSIVIHRVRNHALGGVGGKTRIVGNVYCTKHLL